MELDYRTTFNVTSRFGRTLTEEFDSTVYDWLRHKKLNADALTEGVCELAPNTVGTLARLERQDNTVVSHFRLTEVRPTDTGTVMWQTEVLGYQDATGSGDVLVHVADPRPTGPQHRLNPTGVPRLARLLVAGTDAFDGLMELHDGALILGPEDEDLVHEMIVDPTRRGLLILAATPDGHDPHEFANVVSDLTHGTVGQAGTFVLSPDLMGALDGHLSYLTLPRGGLRMVPPDTDPGSRASVSNAYYITADRIAARDRARVRRHWTWLAREQGNTHAPPKHLQRVQRLITEHERVTLLDEIDAFLARRPQPPTVASPAVTPEVPTDTIAPTADEVVEVAEAVEVAEVVEISTVDELAEASTQSSADVDTDEDLRRALAAALPAADIIRRIEILGGCETLAESLDFALLLAGEYDELREKIAARTAELPAANSSEADLERIMELEDQLAEARADLEEARADLDRETGGARWLREQLTAAGRADLAWAAPATLELSQDFDEVLALANELAYVVFTGDGDITVTLDDMRGSTAAAKNTHRALLALNDYGRARDDGLWTGGGFVAYLNDTPPGYASFSSRNVAAKESDTVMNNPAYRRHRELPMPDGTVVYMESHVKLSQESSVSPRLHFMDDTANSGVVVVGYIGPHLPNTRTN